MNKIDSNEFYSSEGNAEISEFKPFKAEEYYVNEAAKQQMEDFKVNEVSNSFEVEHKESTSTSTDELEKQIKEMEGQPTSATSSSSTSSSSSSSTTSTTSTATASSSSAATATSATAAAASTAATAAVVVAAIVSTSSIISIAIKEKEHKFGDNFIALNMNFGDFAEADAEFGVENRDYKLILTDDKGEKVLERQAYEGDHKYLFPNLKNESEYTVELAAFSNASNTSSSYYKKSFNTLSYSAPTAVLDDDESRFKDGSKFSYDYDYKKISYRAAIYISDLQHEATSYYTAVESNGGYFNTFEDINENNYMICDLDGISGDSFRIKTYAVMGTQEVVLLLDETLGVEFPDDWANVKPKVALTANIDTTTDNSHYVYIEGDSTEYFDPGLYTVEYKFYDDDGSKIDDNVTYLDFIDDAHTRFTSSSMVPYGVASYDVEISYVYDDVRVSVLKQNNIQFTSNQEQYGASLNYVYINENAFVDIVFDSSDTVEIDIKTDFSLDNEDEDYYSYNIYLIDSETNMPVKSELDTKSTYVTFSNVDVGYEYYLRYETVGEFLGGKHIYQVIDNDAQVANIEKPTLQLSDEITPHNGHFDVDYLTELPDNITQCELQLSVYLDEVMDQVYHIDITDAPVGTAEITGVTATSGTIRIEYDLVFYFGYDSPSVIQYGEKSYEIVNNIEIGDLNVTKTDTGRCSDDSWLSTLDFTYLDATDYKVVVTMNDSSTGEAKEVYNNDLQKHISFNGFTNDVTSITVEIKQNDTVVKTKTITPSIFADNPIYSFTCVNPGGMIVTYNNDDSINIYREVNFEDTANQNISYSASLVYGSDYDQALGIYIPNYAYRNFCTDYLSAIEDLDLGGSYASYLYELRIQPDTSEDFYLVFFTETPSGGVEFSSPSYYIEEGNNGYTLNVYNNGYIGSNFMMDGNTYTWDEYEGYSQNIVQYTTMDDLTGKELTFDYNEYYYDPSPFTEKGITLKGNIYKEVTLLIQA